MSDENKLRLEVGKFYQDGWGRKRGPVELTSDYPEYPFLCDDECGYTSFTEEGAWYDTDEPDDLDLVAEWVDEAPPPAPDEAALTDLQRMGQEWDAGAGMTEDVAGLVERLRWSAMSQQTLYGKDAGGLEDAAADALTAQSARIALLERELSRRGDE